MLRKWKNVWKKSKGKGVPARGTPWRSSDDRNHGSPRHEIVGAEEAAGAASKLNFHLSPSFVPGICKDGRAQRRINEQQHHCFLFLAHPLQKRLLRPGQVRIFAVSFPGRFSDNDRPLSFSVLWPGVGHLFNDIYSTIFNRRYLFTNIYSLIFIQRYVFIDIYSMVYMCRYLFNKVYSSIFIQLYSPIFIHRYFIHDIYSSIFNQRYLIKDIYSTIFILWYFFNDIYSSIFNQWYLFIDIDCSLKYVK